MSSPMMFVSVLKVTRRDEPWPGVVAPLVRATSWCDRAAGPAPSQGTQKSQPVNASLRGQHVCVSLSLAPSLKINQ